MVRNFWLEAAIDGYKKNLRGGARNSQYGGMEVTIKQRSKGEITEAVKIISYPKDGKLITSVILNGEFIGEYITER